MQHHIRRLKSRLSSSIENVGPTIAQQPYDMMLTRNFADPGHIGRVCRRGDAMFGTVNSAAGEGIDGGTQPWRWGLDGE